MKIIAPNFESSVSGMNAADFPTIPQSQGRETLFLEKENFVEALSQVLFAASIDETRPILTGVLFIYKEKELILVATDGFRLSQKRISLKGVGETQNVILPKIIFQD